MLNSKSQVARWPDKYSTLIQYLQSLAYSFKLASFFKSTLLALSIIGLIACSGGGGSDKKSTTVPKQNYPFSAWVGKDNTEIDIDGNLPNDAALYSYRNEDCDIANITACTEGHKLLLNNQTIIDPAFTTTNQAFYKLKYQSQESEIFVSLSKPEPGSGSRAVNFKGKMWIIGGFSPNGMNNEVWSSKDGKNWKLKLARNTSPASTQFSVRYGHQVVVFKNKLWVIGGNSTSADADSLNDVWSSEDGITWKKELENDATAGATQFLARYLHQALVFKNKLWVIGGLTFDGKHRNDVWSSEDGKTWKEELVNAESAGANRFSVRTNHQALVFNNRLWVIGGYQQGGSLSSTPLNDAWSSEDGKSWTNELANAEPAGANQFSARHNHQALVFNNQLWVIGGETDSTKENDVWSSADGKAWTKITDSAAFSDRSEHQSVIFDNKLWVIGGLDNSAYKSDVYSSTDGKNWTRMDNTDASFSARFFHQMVEFNNKLWLIGGIDGQARNDVWSSTDGINWTQVLAYSATPPSTQFPARYGHQTVVFNNKLWVIGGETDDSTKKNDVWSSADGKTWEKLTDSAGFSARAQHQSVAFNNKLWVIGGSISNDTSDYLNDVWSSEDGITWTERLANAATPGAKQFSARSRHQVVAFGSNLWMIGGYDKDKNDKNDVLKSSNGIEWETVLNDKKNPTASDKQFSGRYYHEALVFNDKLWVIAGGSVNGPNNEVWSSVDGKAWTKVTGNSDAAFLARSGSQAIVFDNKLWVIGGAYGNTPLNDVWRSEDGATWRKNYQGELKLP